MATQAWVNGQADKRTYSGVEACGILRGNITSFRREQGFVSTDGDVYVETRSGVAGARGVAMALLLEMLAAGCLWTVWRLLH